MIRDDDTLRLSGLLFDGLAGYRQGARLPGSEPA
jgi:hypothetical protein